jgi:hypothetical protein
VISEPSAGSSLAARTAAEQLNGDGGLRNGASAFVLKEAADSELIGAVHAAIEGHTYLNPQLGARIAAEPPPAVVSPDGLTDRELEVLQLLALEGIVPRCPSNRGLAEEAAFAYKDVERVVAVVELAGLAGRVAQLVPVGVVKG